MAKLAFCGLGQMGQPMAARLVEAGHEVVVWNRTAARADPIVQLGARAAASPAEAALGADGAITMVASPAALEEVVFGREGLGATFEPQSTLIDMSTVGPDAVRATAKALPAGVGMLDAPVLGSVPQAIEGTLKIFVGGREEDYRRWSPVLGAMGTPKRLGPLGSGAAMKLVVNSTLMALMSALAEALALADALGLDTGDVLDVLADSPIGAPATGKRPNIERAAYPPNFKLSLARKDSSLVVETAVRTGVDLPLARAALAWMEAADRAGLGDLDYSAVIAQARGTPARPA
jgi:3-hydroxyisobutyrate dehydrogenase-like beta-hydroxyacid dehydrogenase